MHSSPLPSKPDPFDLSTSSEFAAAEADPLTRALEALQGNEHDASLWLAASMAFRDAGQPLQAIDACEACLKVDPKQIEAWFMIAELAIAVGHHELADESYDVIRQLAPQDPRLGTIPVIG